MDMQIIFDTVLQHHRKQQGPCVGDNLECLYRLEDKRGFAGALIPDAEYSPTFEGSEFGEVVQNKWQSPTADKLRPYTGFIENLQSIHDSEAHKLKWSNESVETQLALLAERRNLIYKPQLQA